MGKVVLGLTEKVSIQGNEYTARIDTGAKYSSICWSLARELGLNDKVRDVTIRSSNGIQVRPLVEAEVEVAGKKIKTLMTITDRQRMSYKVLIGTELLKQGFMVDPGRDK